MLRSLVHWRIDNRIGYLILNNPPLNLVTLELVQELDAVLDIVYRHIKDVDVMIVTGAGVRAFCAGSDLSQFGPFLAPGKVVSAKLGPENAAFRRLASLPIATIAAIRGLAFGGGLELACCCDFIVAESSSRVALPEVKLGLIPGSGGTIRVTRRVGHARALELMLLGNSITADQALQWGLINRVAADGMVMDVALRLADDLSSRSASAIALCKQAIAAGLDLDEDSAVASTLNLSDRAFGSPDAREGVRAFLAKESAAFPSRRVADESAT